MSDENVNSSNELSGGEEKPKAIKAIGILSVIFGSIGIVNGLGSIGCSVGCRSLSGLAASELGGGMIMDGINSIMNMQIVFSILSFLVAVFLLVAGILLLKEHVSAIKINLVYVIISIVVQIISIIVINSIIGKTKTMILESGAAGGMEVEMMLSAFNSGFTVFLSGLLGIAYPVLVLLLIVVNKKVKAYFGGKAS